MKIKEKLKCKNCNMPICQFIKNGKIFYRHIPEKTETTHNCWGVYNCGYSVRKVKS